jgi:hypothetical protein
MKVWFKVYNIQKGLVFAGEHASTAACLWGGGIAHVGITRRGDLQDCDCEQQQQQQQQVCCSCAWLWLPAAGGGFDWIKVDWHVADARCIQVDQAVLLLLMLLQLLLVPAGIM